jgi:hypothetical protein
MSSSDYTNLRRLRHMLQPACGSQHYPTTNSPHCVRFPIETEEPKDNIVVYNNYLLQDSYPIMHRKMHYIEDLSCSPQKKVEVIAYEKFSSQTSNPVKVIIVGNATTLPLEKGLSYSYGDGISVVSQTDQNSYFQGIVQVYDKTTGNIAISQIKNVNGTVGTIIDTYLVNILAVRPDLDLVSHRVNALYSILFNVDLADPLNSNFDLISNLSYSHILELYEYFFNQDITLDGDFDLTDDYFNKKVNFLYYEFFDDTGYPINYATFKPVNPNGNGIKLKTLKNKVEQLYLYFFNSSLVKSIIFHAIQ